MTHQILASVAMPCARCGGREAYQSGIHQLSEPHGEGVAVTLLCRLCCPVHEEKPPLEAGEIRPVAGEQGGLFE